MRNVLQHLLCEPGSNARLELEVFRATEENGEQNVIDGILYEKSNGLAYPIISGVPIMMKASFPHSFCQKYSEKLSELETTIPLQISGTLPDDWSFSIEWDQHFDRHVERTWGWTISERLEQFLMELQVDRSWCHGKRILDAGCGNGALSEEISKLGAEVVGIDFSSSVIRAEGRRSSSSVHFLRGDLLSPPLKSDSFDAAISIGVLHHTSNTNRTFDQVARLVKPGGRFYVWLYRKPDGIVRRYIRTPLFDIARNITTRMPKNVQNTILNFHAHLVKTLHLCRKSSVSIPFEEYLVAAYDDLTPRWRHYHTPIEVSRWYHMNGYSSPVLSHWDNPYGFGLVAIKDGQAITPGMHFGSSPKLWEKAQTIIG